MMLKAFSLLDLKTGVYSQPFFFAHRAQATRAVVDMAQDLSTTVGRHPEDFCLYMVGEFDDTIGRLISYDHENHGSAASLLAAAQKPPHLMTASEVVALHSQQREISKELDSLN